MLPDTVRFVQLIPIRDHPGEEDIGFWGLTASGYVYHGQIRQEGAKKVVTWQLVEGKLA
jgi:hypothetical protein